MTAQDDIATVAGQLADLTQAVEKMSGHLREVIERADAQRDRTEIQRERIDLAPCELAMPANAYKLQRALSEIDLIARS